MALLTKKEFAEICHTTTKIISTYQSRGKILYSGDFIDTSIRENLDFLTKKQEEYAAKYYHEPEEPKPETTPEPVVEVVSEKTKPVKPEKPPKEVKVKPIPEKKVKPLPVYAQPDYTKRDARPVLKPQYKEPDTGAGSVYQLKKDKEAAQLTKVEVETKIKEFEYEKLIGNYLPTDLVRNVITQLGKSFISSYKDGADNFLTEFGHRKRLSAVEIAEMKSQLVILINKSHSFAIRDAKAKINAILDTKDDDQGTD